MVCEQLRRRMRHVPPVRQPLAAPAAYAKLYSNRLPVLRSRPPPPTLLEALIGADEDDRPTRAQTNCGSTPPPSIELTHATDIFAAINGTKPSVFGRAAHALLDAAMLAPDAPRVLCVSHSFRQRDEYKPTAHTVPSPHAIIQSPTATDGVTRCALQVQAERGDGVPLSVALADAPRRARRPMQQRVAKDGSHYARPPTPFSAHCPLTA